jgi:hypothetical protein
MLDDDEEWLPDKLERQQGYMDAWDVIASGARRRSNGNLYLPHVGPVSRAALCRDNVLVLSTVTIRRSLVTHGFREDRELAAIADYCMWLDLADAGARIAATPDVVAIYDDTGPDRLSDAAAAVQQRLARHMYQRWRERVSDYDAAVGTAVHASRAAKLRARESLRR